MMKNKPAFTLIEMVIAITVFTLFIGLAMGTYLTFHRAQQEAARTRALILEMESLMVHIEEALHEHPLDYDNVAAEGNTLFMDEVWFTWDEEEGDLFLHEQGQATQLNNSTTEVSYVSFRVFPDENPYTNIEDDSLQFQPIVQVQLQLSTPGSQSVDIETSITSRFYQ